MTIARDELVELYWNKIILPSLDGVAFAGMITKNEDVRERILDFISELDNEKIAELLGLEDFEGFSESINGARSDQAYQSAKDKGEI